MSLRTVSAVVPAYNEERTIRRVVADLTKIDFLTEIIIIDDGSVDKTREILSSIEDPKITILYNEQNKGKGYSVARGIEGSKGEMILILDVDIINYTDSDLRKLTEPVISGRCDFTIKPIDDLVLKDLGGVRCYWR